MQSTELIRKAWHEAFRYLVRPIGPRREEQARIVDAAMKFPLDQVVASYRQQEDQSAEDAADIERELRRFLSICAMYPTTIVPMRGPADKLWHVFITFTREYAAFCQEVAGRFIHHLPARRPASMWRRSRDARLFAALYRRSFGHAPSVVWWPDMALLTSTGRDRNGAAGGGCGGGHGCGGHGCGGGCGGGH